MSLTTSHNSPSPAISLQGVTICHDRRPAILEDVSLDICRGDFIAITGPNGGGKTSLLRVILKLLRPSSGSVAYLTTDGRPDPRLAIGYLPQKSAVDSRFPITVADVIALGLMEPGAPVDKSRRVESMLALMELGDKAGSTIAEVSGGQLQRALLGRALVAEPEVLILDEPLSYLDNRFEKKLYEILRLTMEQRPQTAIVMVSHQMSGVAGMATRHILIDRGRLHEISADDRRSGADAGRG